MDDSEYEIGYGKPPKATRFQKGHSGNPKGKAKGTKSVATLFHDVTRQLIDITENGEGRTVTKIEAIMLQLTTKAVSGDMKAMKEILSRDRIFQQSEGAEDTEASDREKDAAVMRDLLRRMSRSSTVHNDSEAVREEAIHGPVDLTND